MYDVWELQRALSPITKKVSDVITCELGAIVGNNLLKDPKLAYDILPYQTSYLYIRDLTKDLCVHPLAK